MKPVTKRILTISACLTGIGIVMMGAGLVLGGRPGVIFDKSGIASPYQIKEPHYQAKTPVDAFSNLNLQLDSEAEIKIQTSDDENYYIEYQLNGESEKPDYKVQDDTLYISQGNSVEYMVNIFGLNFASCDTSQPYFTLYIPEDAIIEYADIYNDYGNLSISDAKFETASIESDTGNITLNQVDGTDLKLVINDGDLTADALTTDSFFLSCDYGSAKFKESSMKNADIQMESGNLELENSKTDTLKIISQYGDVNLKNVSSTDTSLTLSSGDLDFDAAALEHLNCQMEYGNMNLSLPENISTYQFAVKLEYGDLKLPKDASHEQYQEDDGMISYRTESSSENKGKSITIHSEDGDVNINHH